MITEMTIGGWAFMLLSWGAIIYLCAYAYIKIFSKNTKVMITKRAVLRHIWIEHTILKQIKRWHHVKLDKLEKQGIGSEDAWRALLTLMQNKKVRKIVKKRAG